MAIETLRPDGAGDIDEILPTGTGWEEIDEVTADNDSTFIEGNGGNFVVSESLYTIQNTSIGEFDKVSNITIRARAKKQGAGDPPTLELSIKVGGTVYYYTPQSVSSTSYTTYIYPSFPVSWSDLNSVQIGAKITNTISTTVRITQMYAEVTYTPLKRAYLI